MMRCTLALLLLMAGAPLAGQVRPTPGSGDPRVQTILYDPNQIVQLAVASGYQLTVSFAPGERVETIAVGDSASWQVTTNKRGDFLFIKALGEGRTTNMTVVTDARIYLFELSPGLAYTPEQAFSLRFTYSDDEVVTKAVTEVVPRYRYRIGGARALRPSRVVQDGKTLIVEWPAASALPAIFRIEDDGRESLVSSKVQNDRFIIAGLPKVLRFRLDRQLATARRVKVKGNSP